MRHKSQNYQEKVLGYFCVKGKGKKSADITFEVLDGVRHDVVEDVEATLVRSLEGDPGFLQEVNLHVSSRQLAALVEVDPDELALKWKGQLLKEFS